MAKIASLKHRAKRKLAGLLGYEFYRSSRPLSHRDYEAALNQNTVLLESQSIQRINYACGEKLLGEGWLNVDGRNLSSAANFTRIDLTVKQPLPSGWFAYAYAEDFIEHIDQSDFLVFLTEVYRVLRPGGVVRFSTPDLRNVLEHHYRPANTEAALQAKEQAYIRWQHRHFFSRETIQLLATHIGFHNVEFCATRSISRN
jgi:predicted SAM-dependent methyltransferase